MGFLRHIRSRTKVKSSAADAQIYGQYDQAAYRSARPAPEVPAKVLRLLFTYVCPHKEDEAYTTLEDSMIGDGCMLCDMRDLAHCALVSRSWARVAQDLLYVSNAEKDRDACSLLIGCF